MRDGVQRTQFRDACRQSLDGVGAGDVDGHRLDADVRPARLQLRRRVDERGLVAVDEEHDIDDVDESSRA